MIQKEQLAIRMDGNLYASYLLKALIKPRDSEVLGYSESAVARERRYSMHGLHVGVASSIKFANMF